LGHAVSVAREHVDDQPFVVMLGDDIMHERVSVLRDMLAVHDRHGCSVVALKEVTPAEISSYGCASPGAATPEMDAHLVEIVDIVEKPDPAAAPSNLAVMGRYVFTPKIFDMLDKAPPGRGGEIQLTDAIRLLLGAQTVYGWKFAEGRFDVGNKLDYLRATVELALEREDLGPPFRRYLHELLGGDDAK
ncbi:MAG: UTP--glucose-1-phosphate uridylyltransferase, partial [Acidimicrobiales bacterium]